mmetsp:Transcript_94867/g.245609  ORF Transcript_94867/g.245609 Transcript_94867/m.245609 type:complete len:248 (-) Transcript_94867:139-882(-)
MLQQQQQQQQEHIPNKLFHKTGLCRYHLRKSCNKGNACPFAHGRGELQPLPDLQRTKCCPEMLKGGVCRKSQCRYAHSASELRRIDDPVESQSEAMMRGIGSRGRGSRSDCDGWSIHQDTSTEALTKHNWAQPQPSHQPAVRQPLQQKRHQQHFEDLMRQYPLQQLDGRPEPSLQQPPGLGFTASLQNGAGDGEGNYFDVGMHRDLLDLDVLASLAAVRPDAPLADRSSGESHAVYDDCFVVQPFEL